MTNKLRNKFIKMAFNVLICLLIIPILLVIFVDSPYIPSFDEIFSSDSDTEINEDSITFINVGEGDAILVRSNGRYALIDSGDGVSTNIIRSLEQNGVVGLDALILTHWHDDHVGGVIDILNEFPVLNLAMPRMPNNDESTYKNAVEINNLAEEKGIRFAVLTQGMAINVGDIRITVLYNNPSNEDENDRSAVLMAKCGEKKFLLMADASVDLEKEMLEYGINFDCDVIKIAHHGSNTSTSEELLKAATPQYAVISVARKNSHGHPNYSVLRLLEDYVDDVFRTDYNDDVTFIIEEEELRVETGLTR